MKKKSVAVVFGGFSPEYEVSLKSAYSIINAIDREKYEVILIGITRQGKWYKYAGPEEDIPIDKWQDNARELKPAMISPSRGAGLLVFDGSDVCTVAEVPVDVVFPVLHGKNGEDGTIQGLCELAGIPVVGSGSAASALCMDKDRSHKLVSLSGIRVPKSVCFEYMPAYEEIIAAATEVGLPLFVKPVKTGSSLGITKVEENSKLIDAVKYAFEFDNAVMIEENIDGIEVGCAVVGNNDLQTGRIDEIEVPGGFFDFVEKYTLKNAKIHIPARINEESESRLQEAAKTIYRTLGCRGYARMDMFLAKDGEAVFCEANTIPGFTPFSQFPRMMKAVGVDYPELVDMLIGLGIRSSNFGIED